MSNLSIKHPSQKQCLDLNTCWQVLNQRVIFVLTELNSDVMSHNFYTLSDPYPNVFHISLCIIQSTLPFQGEIFPVLYNPLYHFREIFPVLPCIIQSTLIPERYFLYCPVLCNPLYHFREIFPVLPCIIQSTLPFQGNIFPVLPCIIQSTLPFQGDISCIALYYTIHSIISGRYFLYCPVLYNPLYHFREIFPVLPCIIQSTLPFQGDISCIALYYTIHSIISGRYFLYYAIHSIISGKYFLTLLYW